MDEILEGLAKCRNIKYAGVFNDPYGEYPAMPLFILEETEEERRHHAESNRQQPENGGV